MNDSKKSIVDTYKEILDMYVSKDVDYNDWMKNPFIFNNKVLATEGHFLVAVPYFNNEYKNCTKDISGVYPINYNCNLIINTKNLKSILEQIPMVDSYDEESEECQACDGYGEVDYEYFEIHYGRKYHNTIEGECPVCKGTGEYILKEKILNGKKDYSTEYSIKIENSYFSAIAINLLVKTAELLNSDIIKLKYHNNTLSKNLFLIDDVEVLLMPVDIENPQKTYSKVINLNVDIVI